MKKDENYWDKRGKTSYIYKKEKFYTITPIPFYYKRRNILKIFLKDILKDENIRTILDYGCGDGYYLNYFLSVYSEKNYYGVDISEEMISLAKEKNQAINFYILKDFTPPYNIKFDFIYSIAVFAHILNEAELLNIFIYFHQLLTDNGKIAFFEQTAPKERRGDNWIRRTIGCYIEIAEKCGYKLISYKVISFPAHRFFERKIATIYKKYFVKGNTPLEKSINANKSLVFRMLSQIFLFFSLSSCGNIEEIEGNTLFVFERNKTNGQRACLTKDRMPPIRGSGRQLRTFGDIIFEVVE